MALLDRNQPFTIKLRNWEYWPSSAFYLPLAPFLLYGMARAGNPCFFAAANPGIYSGGLGIESKFETLQKLPERFRPRSVLVRAGAPFSETLRQARAAGLCFPLIAKPDLGFRGLLVKKVDGEQQLQDYLAAYPLDFILQEYLDLPQEVGVLYHRLPGAASGQVTSITTKEFLCVDGDGRRTVEELMVADPRAHLQLERIRADRGTLLAEVPSAGERVALGIVGNHSKGTRFLNGNALIGEAVIRTMDEIARQVEGFYYGRFDLKCESLESLRSGEGIRVIELNGVCSEPTHIYDAERGTYFSALRDILQNWFVILRIARENHRRGIPYPSFTEIRQGADTFFTYRRKIAKLQERPRPHH